MRRWMIAGVFSVVVHVVLMAWRLPGPSGTRPSSHVESTRLSLAVATNRPPTPSSPAPVPERRAVPESREFQDVRSRPAPTETPAPPRPQPRSVPAKDPAPTRSARPTGVDPPDPPTASAPRRAEKTEAPTSSSTRARSTPVPGDASPNRRRVTGAEYRRNPAPPYPSVSRRRGEEGTVVLRVRVDRNGDPLSVRVHRSSGFARLDRAARTSVQGWSFTPARSDGERVVSTVLVPIRFDLRSGVP